MKKNFSISVIVLIFLVFSIGCSGKSTPSSATADETDFDPSTAALNFDYYHNHSLSSFLEDYGLTMEDLTRTAPHSYDTIQPLPLLNTTAIYQLLCDEEDRIVMINLQSELPNDISEDFAQIQYFRDYFNGQNDSLYLNGLEEFSNKAPHINTYETLAEFETALSEYAGIPFEERDNSFFHAFTLKGYWNLGPDVQIQMEYRQSPEAQRSMLFLTLRSSQTGQAIQPDGTLILPEDASLFRLPGQSASLDASSKADASLDASSEAGTSPDAEPEEESVQTIQWLLPKQALKQTQGFFLEEGRQIFVDLSVTPADAEVKLGLVNSIGERTVFTGNDVLSNIFTIPSPDTYRIFLENGDDAQVEVTGTFHIL